MQYKMNLDNGMTGTVEQSVITACYGLLAGAIGGYFGYKSTSNFLNKTNQSDNQSDYQSNNQSDNQSNNQSDYQSNNQSDYQYDNESDNQSDNESDNQSDNESEQPQYESLQEYFDNLPELEKPTQLGDRMKFYEEYTDKYISEIDSFTNFVIRLDGRSFSKLLSSLKSDEFNELKTPFINDFKLAMDKVTADLIKEFNAATGYNHSDEISLVFKSLNEDTDDELIKEHMFCGRVSKLLSLTASYASVRLSKYLREYNSNKFDMMYDRVTFDSRVIIFPNDNELCNYFVWRSKYDCYRNFVNEIVYRYFPKKSLDKLNTQQRVEKLKSERDLDVNDFNPFLRYGTFIKRELRHYKDENKQNFWRNIYVRFALPNLCCSEDYIDLFKCKNFEEWEYQNIDFELISEF